MKNVGDPDGFGRFGILDRDEDTVVCHECGRGFRMLVQHLRQAHGTSVADYRRAHGLPATLPLTCLDTSRTIGRQSKARVGTDSWRTFEEARDRSLPTSQQAATRASARTPAPATTQRRRDEARERFSGIRETWHDEEWNAALAEVVQFHASTGRWPMRGARAEADGVAEGKLGRWLAFQRRQARKGRLPAWRLSALEAVGVNLRPVLGRPRQSGPTHDEAAPQP